MKSKKIIVAALVAVAAIALAGCSPRSSMATLSTDSDSETAEVFSLAKVLNLGTNYLTSLDYDNAILQYIDIIQHDPTNKEAYAGLYAAYAAQGKADEANKVFEQAQEVFDDEADFLPGFLDDAKLVFESGGGNVPFQMLSEHFWDDLNSVFAKDVGEAWIAADPQNADPYALLGAHYAALDDESGIEKLLHGGAESQLEPAASVNLHRFCPHLLDIGSGSSFVLQNVNLRLLRVHHDRDKTAVAGTVKGQEVKGIGSAAKHALTGAVCRVGFIGYLVNLFLPA